MVEDVLFRRIAAAVIVSLFAVSIYYRNRADKAGGRVARDDEPTPLRLALSVSGLMGFGGLLLYFIWPPALDWTLLPLPTQLRWMGVAIATLSVASTWWVFRTLGAQCHANLEDARQRHPGDYGPLSLRTPPVLRERRPRIWLSVAGDAQLVVHRVDRARARSAGCQDAAGGSQPRGTIRRCLARVCRPHGTLRSAPRTVK